MPSAGLTTRSLFRIADSAQAATVPGIIRIQAEANQFAPIDGPVIGDGGRSQTLASAMIVAQFAASTVRIAAQDPPAEPFAVQSAVPAICGVAATVV